MEHALVTVIVAVAAFAVMAPAIRGTRKSAKNDSPCGGGCGGCNLGCDLKSKLAITGAVLALLVTPAAALDTVEPYDAGATDAEYYLGYGGMGQAAADRELSNEIVLGYGLMDGFATYLGTCVAVDQQYFRGESSLCFGLIGTPLETDHVDVDLALDVGAAGDGLGTLSLSPMAEVNYDHDPEMGSWGLYLRGGYSAYGGSGDPALGSSSARRLVDFTVNPGAYLRLTERHELLVEYDRTMGVGDDRTADETVHGFAIGMNSLVTPSLELVTQLHRDVPRTGQDATWSFTLGFIAGLPTGN